jgi:ubiquinone/menaquinone biosynthesis C-methylase UbiE
MLAVGRDRAIDPQHSSGIEWIAGDAEAFRDRTADACTIASASAQRDIRHARSPRCTASCGPAGVSSASNSESCCRACDLYDRYSRRALPTLGAVIARDRASYESLEAFAVFRRRPNLPR